MPIISTKKKKEKIKSSQVKASLFAIHLINSLFLFVIIQPVHFCSPLTFLMWKAKSKTDKLEVQGSNLQGSNSTIPDKKAAHFYYLDVVRSHNQQTIIKPTQDFLYFRI